METMFYYAVKFNQDISNWDVSNVTGHFDAFDGCNIEEYYKPNFN
jgi:surface protein